MHRWLARSSLHLASEKETYSSETRSEIAIHRVLCLLGMGVVSSFGLFYGWSNPDATDPLWARLGVAGLFGALLAASFAPDHIRRNYAGWMRGALYVLMAWFAAITVLNQFADEYVLGLLLTYSVLITIVGVGARSLGPVLRFEVAGLLLVCGGLLIVPSPQASSGLLVACVVTVAIVQAIAIQGNVATRETLRARESHLRGIANSVPGVVFQFAAADDGTYGFNFVSDQAKERLGITTRGDDIFEHFIERVPGPARDRVVGSISAAVEEQRSWRQEIPYRGTAGEQLWLLGDAVPEKLDGDVVFNGVALDITDRKRAETEAELQSQILDRVMQGDPFRSILEDLVQKIEAQRPAMRGSILLYDESDGCLRHGAAPNLPNSYNRAIDGLNVGPHAGSCGTAVHTGEPVITDDILDDPRWDDYREVAAEHDLRACWSVPFWDSSGTLLGTFAMYYDEPRAPTPADRRLIDHAQSLASLAIERHRNAEELRLLSEAIRQSTEAVAIMESDSSEREPGPITYVNRAFTEITGYEPDDAMGESSDILHGPDTEPWVLRRRMEHVRAGEAFEGRVVHYRKDGTPFVNHVRIAPVRDESGTVTHWVSLHRDVTARRKTDERMLEVQDEERRRIDREIRQELGGLLATLQMTLDLVRTEMNERGVETDRLREVENLVQDVSNVARTISHRLHPTALREHGLQYVLPSLVNGIEERKDLTVDLQTDIESEDEIGSLVAMIAFRVVQEALENVGQHAQTDEVDVVVRQRTQELRLQITDEGVGFDPTVAMKEQTYGLLGMKKRVERLNGHLEVDAVPGEGTQISVTLPLNRSLSSTGSRR